MKYLVGIEDCQWSAQEDGYTIIVTDDYEGFGPGLMATIDGRPAPTKWEQAETPMEAGLQYFNNLPVYVRLQIDSIMVNLTSGYEEYKKADRHGKKWEDLT